MIPPALRGRIPLLLAGLLACTPAEPEAPAPDPGLTAEAPLVELAVEGHNPAIVSLSLSPYPS